MVHVFFLLIYFLPRFEIQGPNKRVDLIFQKSGRPYTTYVADLVIDDKKDPTKWACRVHFALSITLSQEVDVYSDKDMSAFEGKFTR